MIALPTQQVFVYFSLEHDAPRSGRYSTDQTLDNRRVYVFARLRTHRSAVFARSELGKNAVFARLTLDGIISLEQLMPEKQVP